MCAPGHAEWGVCLLLEQVVGLTDTRQTAVCDESCRVGGPGWGRDRARGQRGLMTGGEGYGAVVPEVMTRSRSSPLMVTSNQ